jgi:hypothetical protein
MPYENQICNDEIIQAQAVEGKVYTVRADDVNTSDPYTKHALIVSHMKGKKLQDVTLEEVKQLIAANGGPLSQYKKDPTVRLIKYQKKNDGSLMCMICTVELYKGQRLKYPQIWEQWPQTPQDSASPPQDQSDPWGTGFLTPPKSALPWTPPKSVTAPGMKVVQPFRTWKKPPMDGSGSRQSVSPMPGSRQSVSPMPGAKQQFDRGTPQPQPQQRAEPSGAADSQQREAPSGAGDAPSSPQPDTYDDVDYGAQEPQPETSKEETSILPILAAAAVIGVAGWWLITNKKL